VKQDNLQIDLLVLNAGIMALPNREETADGFEKQVRRERVFRIFPHVVRMLHVLTLPTPARPCLPLPSL